MEFSPPINLEKTLAWTPKTLQELEIQEASLQPSNAGFPEAAETRNASTHRTIMFRSLSSSRIAACQKLSDRCVTNKRVNDAFSCFQVVEKLRGGLDARDE